MSVANTVGHSNLRAEFGPVMITDLLTELAIFSPIVYSDVAIAIANTGSANFNAFDLSVRVTEQDDWLIIYDQASDWTSPIAGGFIRYAQSSPILSAFSKTQFYLEPIGAWGEIRLRASVASDSTTAIARISRGGCNG